MKCALTLHTLTHTLLEWNICDKRITTKTAPGVITTVIKNTKTGMVWQYTMAFNDRGVTFDSKAGDVKCTEYYK